MPLTNDIHTENTPVLEMKALTVWPPLPEEESEGEQPSVSPDPFEATLEVEKGSLDSKGSS